MIKPSKRVWKGGGGGGPDPAFPLFFQENPASHTVFHYYPESQLSFSEKNTFKSQINTEGNE